MTRYYRAGFGAALSNSAVVSFQQPVFQNQRDVRLRSGIGLPLTENVLLLPLPVYGVNEKE